jgi:hypothetical protein
MGEGSRPDEWSRDRRYAARESLLSVFYPSTARLAAAHAPMSIQALVLTHAGHRTSPWSSELPQVFTWLGRYIPGFAP